MHRLGRPLQSVWVNGLHVNCDRADDVFGVSDDDGVEDESAEEGDVGGILRVFGNDCGADPDL